MPARSLSFSAGHRSGCTSCRSCRCPCRGAGGASCTSPPRSKTRAGLSSSWKSLFQYLVQEAGAALLLGEFLHPLAQLLPEGCDVPPAVELLFRLHGIHLCQLLAQLQPFFDGLEVCARAVGGLCQDIADFDLDLLEVVHDLRKQLLTELDEDIDVILRALERGELLCLDALEHVSTHLLHSL